MSCPNYGELLWFVTHTLPKEQTRIDIETHIKLCERCRETIATMNCWTKEDAEVCAQIDALSLPALKKRFEKALAEDNAAEITVIVERIGGIAKFCISLLKVAAEQAPGVARPHAKMFFYNLNDLYPEEPKIPGYD